MDAENVPRLLILRNNRLRLNSTSETLFIGAHFDKIVFREHCEQLESLNSSRDKTTKMPIK